PIDASGVNRRSSSLPEGPALLRCTMNSMLGQKVAVVAGNCRRARPAIGAKVVGPRALCRVPDGRGRDFEEPVRRDSTNDRGLAASAGRINRVEGGKRDAFDSN